MTGVAAILLVSSCVLVAAGSASDDCFTPEVEECYYGAQRTLAKIRQSSYRSGNEITIREYHSDTHSLEVRWGDRQGKKKS